MKRIVVALILMTGLMSLQAQEDRVKVLIKTNMGDMKVELFNETPKHRDNFIKLVKDKFYEGVLFHRVINGFMIQAGDPDSKTAPAGKMLGSGDVGYTVEAEIKPGLYHYKGALSAARLGDEINPRKASSGCQFYIVQGKVYPREILAKFTERYGIQFTEEQKTLYTTIGGTPHLDGNYTVFGQVIEGLEIIDKIAAVKTDPNDRPLENVKIISMKIVGKK